MVKKKDKFGFPIPEDPFKQKIPAPPQPIVKPPIADVSKVPDLSTLAGRLAAANVLPKQGASMGGQLSEQLKQTYAGQLSPEQQAIRARNEQINIAQAQENIKKPTPKEVLQIGTLTPEQRAREAFTEEGMVSKGATGVSIAAAGAAGAKAGALLGSAIAPGVGTAIGAVAGGLFGAGGVAFTKISIQKRQDVKEAFKVYQGSKTNFDFIINQANAGKITSGQAVEMWDEELANFYAAERGIKSLTKNDLNRFLSGGMDEVRQIESFKRRLPLKQAELVDALTNPDPTKIITSENEILLE